MAASVPPAPLKPPPGSITATTPIIRAYEIAIPPETEVMAHNAGLLAPVERTAPPDHAWTFPAASVTAMELKLSSRL